MQGVDLTRFQFDFDLTWAALFLDAEGGVYARYGSGATDDMRYMSIEGLRRTMERVLAAHRARAGQGTPPWAVARRGPAPRWKTPEDIPASVMADRRGRDVDDESCIHCHMVNEALLEIAARSKDYDPREFGTRYPPPEQFGIGLDVDEGRRVIRVERGSIAARAGIKEDDEILAVAGNPVHSIADIQWELGDIAEGQRPIVVERAGERRTLNATFPKAGRRPDLVWRTSMYSMPPKPGLWLETGEGRGLRLEVRGVFGAAVKRAGLKKGDVIVEVDGRSEPMTESEFHTYVRLTHFESGARMKLRVLRSGKERRITVRF